MLTHAASISAPYCVFEYDVCRRRFEGGAMDSLDPRPVPDRSLLHFAVADGGGDVHPDEDESYFPGSCSGEDDVGDTRTGNSSLSLVSAIRRANALLAYRKCDQHRAAVVHPQLLDR